MPLRPGGPNETECSGEIHDNDFDPTRRQVIKLLGLAAVGTAVSASLPVDLLANQRKYPNLPEEFSSGISLDQSPDAPNQMSPELLETLVGHIQEAFERIDRSDRVRHRTGKISVKDLFPARSRTQDVLRILALIVKESGGDSNSKSKTNAIGLCQVKGIALAEIGKQFPYLQGKSYNLYDPTENVLLGLIYLKILERFYVDQTFGEDNPDTEKLLFASYNGGTGRLGGMAQHYGTRDWETIAGKASSAIVKKQAADSYGPKRPYCAPVETLDQTYGVTYTQYDTGMQHAGHADDVLLEVDNTPTTIRKAQEIVRYAELIPGIARSFRFGASSTRSPERVRQSDVVRAKPVRGEGIYDFHKRFQIDTDFKTWVEEFRRANALQSNALSRDVSYEIPGVRSVVVATTLYAALKGIGMDPKLYPVVWAYNVHCNPDVTRDRDINHLEGQEIYIPPRLAPGEPKEYEIGPEGSFASLWALLSQLKPTAVKITPQMLADLVQFNKDQSNEAFRSARVEGLSVLGLPDEFTVVIPASLFGTTEAEVPPSPENVPYEFEQFTLEGATRNPYQVSMKMFAERRTNMLKEIDYFQDEGETEFTRRQYLRLILERFNQQYYRQVIGKPYDARTLKKILIPTDPRYYEKILEDNDEDVGDGDGGAGDGVPVAPEPVPPIDVSKRGSNYVDARLEREGNEVITNPSGFKTTSCKRNERYDSLSRRASNRSATTHIILHSTDSTAPEGTLKGGKAHFVVTQSGEIIQVRDVGDRINHAGRGQRGARGAFWDGNPNITDCSIGIEVCQRGGNEWNNAQYEAVEKLTQFLGCKYGIKKRNVLGHYQVACSRFGRGRKKDPYIEVDWEKLGLPDNSQLIDSAVVEGKVNSNLAVIQSDCGFSEKALAGLEAAVKIRAANR